MLDLARMLKTTVHNRSQNLGLEKKVSEATAVNGDVITLDSSFFLGFNSVLSSISLHRIDEYFNLDERLGIVIITCSVVSSSS